MELRLALEFQQVMELELELELVKGLQGLEFMLELTAQISFVKVAAH